MQKRIITYLIFSLILFPLGAQKIFVRGYALDDEKYAVGFATVQLKGTTTGVITNEKGFFDISFPQQLVKDTIILRFSCIGYETVERVIPMTIDKVYNVVVTMPRSTTELDQVEVKGLRRQTSTMVAIDPSALKVIPDASGGNFESILTSFAGVSSNNEMSSQYSVRGGNYDENSVYVNGIEVYRPLLVRRSTRGS